VDDEARFDDGLMVCHCAVLIAWRRASSRTVRGSPSQSGPEGLLAVRGFLGDVISVGKKRKMHALWTREKLRHELPRLIGGEAEDGRN